MTTAEASHGHGATELASGSDRPVAAQGPTIERRARRRLRLPGLDFKAVVPLRWSVPLGIMSWAVLLGAWQVAAWQEWVNTALVPGPIAVLTALVELFTEHAFLGDVWKSVLRIAGSFALACAVAVPVGVLMGAFPLVEKILNPIVSPARYLPAPSFTPLLLMWFGAGETQKLALLVLGVIWFLLALIADHTRHSRVDLIETSRTLGGDRRQVLMTVVVPEVLPDIVTAMRQMLAVSWTYLVIAEIVAATDGIGAMMMRAARFVHTDRIMAGILVIGVLGLLFDVLFRLAHRWMFPYLYLKGE